MWHLKQWGGTVCLSRGSVITKQKRWLSRVKGYLILNPLPLLQQYRMLPSAGKKKGVVFRAPLVVWWKNWSLTGNSGYISVLYWHVLSFDTSVVGFLKVQFCSVFITACMDISSSWLWIIERNVQYCFFSHFLLFDTYTLFMHIDWENLYHRTGKLWTVITPCFCRKFTCCIVVTAGFDKNKNM